MQDAQVSVGINVLRLFFEASFFVQIIVIGLLGASILCWTIIFDKWYFLRRLQRSINSFETLFWSGLSLDEIAENETLRKDNPMSLMFLSAMQEWKQENRGIDLVSRVERTMNVVLQRETEQMDSRMDILASIGSASPFVGLLGTVWGIMTSFTSIAAVKQISLTVVAPGIAEALLATALGLFAAIPATIAYNKIAADIDVMQARFHGFIGAFVAILSRHIKE